MGSDSYGLSSEQPRIQVAKNEKKNFFWNKETHIFDAAASGC